MTRFVYIVVAGWLVVCSGRASTTNSTPVFNEVYNLVRTHLHGMSASELDQTAVEGLLAGLGPRVLLITNEKTDTTASPLVSQKRVLEDNVAYIRVSRVANGLAEAVAEAYRDLKSTGNVVGLVLDLRYTGGEDYAAACTVAGLFLRTNTVLLDWGTGVVGAEPAAQPILQPVAVLMNRETCGAAEALAAALREVGVALLLGNQTAGAAARRQEFVLTTGQKLQIATSPVKLANGTELSPRGVRPDIEVVVSKESEKAFFADPYREAPKPAELGSAGEMATNQVAGTNRVIRRARPSEADLVRARREGLPLDGEMVGSRESEPVRPVLRDPVLARAVDLLKGLAIVRSTRR